MADRGFTEQDLFASYRITMATSDFAIGRGYLKELVSDRKLSKYRVHEEKVIGLLEIYNILSSKLNHN